MIVYKITNIITGKFYIGQTTQPLSERWWQHCNRSPSQSHRSYIYNAIIEYGVQNFVIEEIDKASTLDELNLMEAVYIKALNAMAPNGYNLHPGGKGKKCHPDTKKKISQKLKGRPIKNRMNGAPKGRPVSEERRLQISSTLKGKPQPWKHKKIIAIETNTVYESINSAAKALNINRTIISTHLKTGQQHKKTGLTFRFYNNSIKG